MNYLNEQGKYDCLYINVEAAQAMRENVFESLRIILGELSSSARYYLSEDYFETIWFV